MPTDYRPEMNRGSTMNISIRKPKIVTLYP
jgi:hypothetical protein